MLYSTRASFYPYPYCAMNGRAITALLLVLIIIGGIVWYFGDGMSTTSPTDTATQTETPTATTTPDTGTPPAGGTTSPADATIVTYTAQGYSPATVTVPVNGAVTFVNESSVDMWVGADEHPTHTEYDGTSRAQHCAETYTGPSPFDSCTRIPPGQSWGFVFTKAGTFDYHDHVDASKRGRIVVSGTAVSGSVNVNVQ